MPHDTAVPQSLAVLKTKKNFTTGEIKKLGGPAPKTTSDRVDETIEICRKLTEAPASSGSRCANALEELRQLRKGEDKQAFETRLATLQKELDFAPELNGFTAAVLNGAPPPFRVNGDADGDRRIPRELAVMMFKQAGMQGALEMLGEDSKSTGPRGVVFACVEGANYQDGVMKGLDAQKYYAATTMTGTGTDAAATAEIMKREDKQTPVIIADTSISSAEVKALIRRYGKEGDVIAVINDWDDPKEFTQLGAKAALRPSDGELAPRILDAFRTIEADRASAAGIPPKK